MNLANKKKLAFDNNLVKLANLFSKKLFIKFINHAIFSAINCSYTLPDWIFSRTRNEKSNNRKFQGRCF